MHVFVIGIEESRRKDDFAPFLGHQPLSLESFHRAGDIGARAQAKLTEIGVRQRQIDGHRTVRARMTEIAGNDPELVQQPIFQAQPEQAAFLKEQPAQSTPAIGEHLEDRAGWGGGDDASHCFTGHHTYRAIGKGNGGELPELRAFTVPVEPEELTRPHNLNTNGALPGGASDLDGSGNQKIDQVRCVLGTKNRLMLTPLAELGLAHDLVDGGRSKTHARTRFREQRS